MVDHGVPGREAEVPGARFSLVDLFHDRDDVVVANRAGVQGARLPGADGFYTVNVVLAEIFAGQRAVVIFLGSNRLGGSDIGTDIVLEGAGLRGDPAEVFLMLDGVTDFGAEQIGLLLGVFGNQAATLLENSSGSVAHNQATVLDGERTSVLENLGPLGGDHAGEWRIGDGRQKDAHEHLDCTPIGSVHAFVGFLG